MAKRKHSAALPKRKVAKKKAAKKKTAKRGQSRAEVDKVLSGPIRRPVKPAAAPKPRTMRLPEFGNISRVKELGEICQSLRGILDQEAEQRETKQGLRNNALQIMKKRDISAYVEFGVELLRTSGTEKISFRKVKGESLADEERDEPSKPDANGEGDGGDERSAMDEPPNDPDADPDDPDEE